MQSGVCQLIQLHIVTVAFIFGALYFELVFVILNYFVG